MKTEKLKQFRTKLWSQAFLIYLLLKKACWEVIYLSFDECCYWKIMKCVCKIIPDIIIAIFAETFIIESIGLCDLARFVIATEDNYSVFISYFEKQQQGQAFNAVISYFFFSLTANIFCKRKHRRDYHFYHCTYLCQRSLPWISNWFPFKKQIIVEYWKCCEIILMNFEFLTGTFPPILNSSIKSKNYPWISPQTITGARTFWTFDSFLKTSFACILVNDLLDESKQDVLYCFNPLQLTCSQIDFTSFSDRILHCRTVSIYFSIFP